MLTQTADEKLFTLQVSTDASCFSGCDPKAINCFPAASLSLIGRSATLSPNSGNPIASHSRPDQRVCNSDEDPVAFFLASPPTPLLTARSLPS